MGSGFDERPVPDQHPHHPPARYRRPTRISRPGDEVKQLVGILTGQAVQLLEALTKLGKGRDLNRHHSTVHDLEHRADGLSRAAIGRLFKGGLDPLEVIKLRDLYKTLEETIDAAEDAAEVIERILAKS